MKGDIPPFLFGGKNMGITALQSSSSAPPPATSGTADSTPNFSQLLADYQELINSLADLEANLKAYMAHPHGKNSSKELDAVELDLGRLLTLCNKDSPGNFFAAANGDPSIDEAVSSLSSCVEMLREEFVSGNLKGLATLLQGSALYNSVSGIYWAIFGNGTNPPQV